MWRLLLILSNGEYTNNTLESVVSGYDKTIGKIIVTVNRMNYFICHNQLFYFSLSIA